MARRALEFPSVCSIRPPVQGVRRRHRLERRRGDRGRRGARGAVDVVAAGDTLRALGAPPSIRPQWRTVGVNTRTSGGIVDDRYCARGRRACCWGRRTGSRSSSSRSSSSDRSRWSSRDAQPAPRLLRLARARRRARAIEVGPGPRLPRALLLAPERLDSRASADHPVRGDADLPARVQRPQKRTVHDGHAPGRRHSARGC